MAHWWGAFWAAARVQDALSQFGNHLKKRYLDDSSAHFVLEEFVKGYPNVRYPNLWRRYKEAVDQGKGDRIDRAFSKIATTVVQVPVAGGMPPPTPTPSPGQSREQRIQEFLESLEQFPRTPAGDEDFGYALKLLESNRFEELGKKIWVQGKRIGPSLKTVWEGLVAAGKILGRLAREVVGGQKAQDLERWSENYKNRSRRTKL